MPNVFGGTINHVIRNRCIIRWIIHSLKPCGLEIFRQTDSYTEFNETHHLYNLSYQLLKLKDKALYSTTGTLSESYVYLRWNDYMDIVYKCLQSISVQNFAQLAPFSKAQYCQALHMYTVTSCQTFTTALCTENLYSHNYDKCLARPGGREI